MRLRYLNPFLIRNVVSDARRVTADGLPPRAVRLAGVEGPNGWVLPTATPTIEVVGRRHGKIEQLKPEFPVPLPLALGWRLARRLIG